MLRLGLQSTAPSAAPLGGCAPPAAASCILSWLQGALSQQWARLASGSAHPPAPPPPAPPPLPPPSLPEAWAQASLSIEQAATPPSSWYTQPSALQAEERTVFRRSWLAVARAGQLAAPGAFAAGSLLGLQWLACRDEQGQLRAFHNVSAPCDPNAVFGGPSWVPPLLLYKLQQALH